MMVLGSAKQAGHAILGALMNDYDVVAKISRCAN